MDSARSPALRSIGSRHAMTGTSLDDSGSVGGSSDVQLARKQALAAITANKNAVRPSNVTVGVRSRPLNEQEVAMGDGDVWLYDKADAGLLYEQREDGSAGKEYKFDCVFAPDAGTTDVYEPLCLPIVEAALEGFNGTLFAYGQVRGSQLARVGAPPTARGCCPPAPRRRAPARRTPSWAPPTRPA